MSSFFFPDVQAPWHGNLCFNCTTLSSSRVSCGSEAPGMSNLSKILLGAMLIHWVKQFYLPKQATQAYEAILVSSLLFVFALDNEVKWWTIICLLFWYFNLLYLSKNQDVCRIFSMLYHLRTQKKGCPKRNAPSTTLHTRRVPAIEREGKRKQNPYVITFNPYTACLAELINRNLDFQESKERLAKIFKKSPLIANRRLQSIRDTGLSQSTPDQESAKGCSPCEKSRCSWCKFVKK